MREYGAITKTTRVSGWFEYDICLLVRTLCNDLLHDVWWYFLVLRKLHGRSSTSLTHRTDVVRVTEKVRKRYVCTDQLSTARDVFHSVNTATARVKVADDVTHEVLRC